MKKYRFESIQKNEVVTIHQSFNVPAENSRQALMYGIVHMIQDKTATSITTKVKPLCEPSEEDIIKHIERTLERKMFFALENAPIKIAIIPDTPYFPNYIVEPILHKLLLSEEFQNKVKGFKK